MNWGSKMTDPTDHTGLDALLAEAKATPVPDISEGLMARIMADAAGEMPRAAPVLDQPGGLWATLLAAIGGWTAISGLTTATIVGFWFGISPPAAVESIVSDIAGGSTTISLYAESDLLGIGG